MLPGQGDREEKTVSGLLGQAASEIGVFLSPFQTEKFEIYLAELKEWNKKINLTALKNDQDIISKHFVDSLTPIAFISLSGHVLDIGSGAGFPGIPLKIANPSLFMTLVEARRKKVYFLRHIIRTLGLRGIRADHLYLDSGTAQGPHFYKKFDVVISRAAFDLKTFLGLSLFLLKERGCAIAMKGPNVQEEIDIASQDAGLDALHLANNSEILLPITHEKRRVVVYAKS